MIGTVLGNRYEIIEEIGKGGMANVYKAHCKLLNRMVAVKVLKQELEDDTDYLKRFNVEAQAAASLVHPNIVSIFDFGEDDGYHYIVMELIDGITLKQYINEKAPLDTKEALGIAYQICDAIAVAHQNNIVHRDIKPHNIMITSDHRIKVTDFGIARASMGSTMTADTSVLGSVHYISPEQARGSVVDGRTDLYSLGVVLYEMLTGRVPFESDSPVAIAMKHIDETPVSPREYNPEITPALEQLVLKAMAKDVSSRYQKTAEFSRDMMKLLENPNAVIDSLVQNDDDNIDHTLKIPAVSRGADHNADIGDDDIYEDDLPEKETPVQRRQRRHDSKELYSQNKKILIGAIATALVIVGLISLGVTYVLYPDAPLFHMFDSEKIEVPDFYNMKLAEAQELAENKGLKLEVKDEVIDDSVEDGHVLDQSPNAGRPVAKDSVVYVTISIGEEEITLDDYIMSKYETAVEELEEQGFAVETEFVNDDEVPENYVISQTPEAGEEMRKGSTVKLTVSKGPEETTVTVPNLVGKTLDKAKEDIERHNLAVGNISYEESVVDKDTVIRQNISGGEAVGMKTPINLVVSKGKNEDKKGEDKNDEQNNNSGNSDTSNKDNNSGNNTQNNNSSDNKNNNDNKEPDKKPEQPANTDKGPKDKYLSYTINSDKEEVTIRVTEDGKAIYEGIAFPTNKPDFSLKVSGKGQKTYEIYVDGNIAATKTINFDE